ncbi:MAG: hypothetical protein WBC05_01295 [Sedimentisphaerales bacterium]
MKSPIEKLAAATLIIAAAFIAIHQFNGSLDRAIFTRIDSSGNVRKCKILTWKITLLDKATILRCMASEPYYVRVVWPRGRTFSLTRTKVSISKSTRRIER